MGEIQRTTITNVHTLIEYPNKRESVLHIIMLVFLLKALKIQAFIVYWQYAVYQSIRLDHD